MRNQSPHTDPPARPRLSHRTGIWCVALWTVCLLGAALMSAPAIAALPEGRAYEQVSPEFKAGYPVLGHKGLSAIAASGGRVAFSSIGAFSGSGADPASNSYVAHRTVEGWKTEAVLPHKPGECLGAPVFSSDLLRVTLIGSVGAGTVECEDSSTNTLWVRGSDGSLDQASPVMTTVGGVETSGAVVGGSVDLTRLVLTHSDAPEDHVLSEEINDETISGTELYEVDEARAGLVAVNNNGVQLTRYCDVNLGGPGSKFGTVSQPAASEVFFGVNVNTRSNISGECETTSPSHPQELFLRAAGSQTLEVSRPLGETCSEVPCPKASLRAPATFQGASEDGSLVYFTMADTASEPLVPGNKDHSNDLYVARIGCAGGAVGEACGSAPREVISMELASPDVVAGQSAEVQPHVVAVSPYGSHVYFVARGVLSEATNEHGEVAVDGGENLYVYDRSSTPARVSFIAELCSGPELSGGVRDGRCPISLNEVDGGRRPPAEGVNDRELWEAGARAEAQTTLDGRFLVFGTFARLISSGPEADVDSSEDIYRYDELTGSLRRVSVAEAGEEGNGNGSFDANIAVASFGHGEPQEQYELNDRAITDDGSRVVFTTSEPLSSRDATGQRDVYVWNEGRVGMISCGCSTENDEEPVITPSGNDIMFLTSAGLVSSDTDGLADLYDARVGGGFPVSEAPSEPCLADSCYGPLSTPAPVLVPGSVTQPAGGNLVVATVVAKATTVKKAKVTRKKPRKRKKRARGARAARKGQHTTSRGGHGR